MLYGFLFPVIYGLLDVAALPLMVVPVSISGWLLGRWHGLAAGVFTVPVRVALLSRVGAPALLPVDHVVRAVVFCAWGFTVGYISELLSKLQIEVEERRKSQEVVSDQERRLRMLLQQMPAVLWSTDRDLVFTTGLGAGLTDLGVGVEGETSLQEFFASSKPVFNAEEAHRRALSGEAVADTFKWRDRVYQVRVEPLLHGADGIVGTLGIALDVTQQSQTQAALFDVEQRFRKAFDYGPVGSAVVEYNGHCTMVNRALCTMLGCEEDDLIHQSIARLAHPDDLAPITQKLFALTAEGGHWLEAEVRLFHKQGHLVWALASIALIRDRAGEPGYLICQLQDITDRKRFEQQLRHQADHDPLTGLYNRRRFREEVQAKVRNGQGVVLFIDLDGFKQVNDLLGHEAGDELLRDVSGMLRQALQEGEAIGRLGGDEFAVLLPGADAQRVREVVRQVQDGLRQLVVLFGDIPMTVTASVGVTHYPEHGTTPEELLSCADMAMYHVKESGRNGQMTFSPDVARQGFKHARSLWESNIRRALERPDGFVLHAQPILELDQSQVTWYELLLRMKDDEGGLIRPGDFLDIAERLGLIHSIDRWVIGEAVRILKADPDLKVSINLSGRSVTSDEIAMYAEQCLEHTGVDPSRLMLEITETAAILDWESAGRFITRLKRLGCRFALDDFGAGYASFHQLKHLPVDCLKIDGHLVKRLPEFPADRHVVRAIADMARGLGMVAVAEFVEDSATMEILRECGVAYGQGYHIGRPVPLESLKAEVK